MLDSDKENLKLEAMKIIVGVRDKEGGCVVSWVIVRCASGVCGGECEWTQPLAVLWCLPLSRWLPKERTALPCSQQ